MAWTWLRKLAANPTARIILGERGEDHAARHLRRQGYKILVRRFKSRSGEIDIVARHGEWLVFVEVKTRKSDRYGAPSESVNRQKQRHMSKVALDYLRLLNNPQVRFRFDIVEVLLPEGAKKPDDIRLIQNAFDLSEPFVYQQAMLAKVHSAAVLGIDAYPVEVEVNSGWGQPAVIIVGLPDAAVKESRDRVKTAIENSGFKYVMGRTTINLAPADVKKEGPSFDLPIAIGMLAVSEQIVAEHLHDYVIVGELALSGAVRAVNGVLPITLCARVAGKRGVIVPSDNAAEAAVVQGIEVYPAKNLREVAEFLAGKKVIMPVSEDPEQIFQQQRRYDIDLADVKGQEHVKRAFEVAAAGGHNVIMVGPPGSGKTLLAKRVPTFLPGMTLEESLETTKIHSICGLLPKGQALVATRPFRSPHHTTSSAGLLGGTSSLTPGEISLANHGVLFLDELPEFHRDVLEAMREPLEEGRVVISRATGTMTFPANFMLVAAMNPCPCGYYGDPKRECRCSPNMITKYRNRISGPLLDRIDIHVEVPAVKYKEMAGEATGESSETVRGRVEEARAVQRHRFKHSNARMTPKQIKEHCRLDEESQELLKMAMTELNLSARAYDRILKVSRTIADLAGSEWIQPDHISEAIQYRSLDRQLWV